MQHREPTDLGPEAHHLLQTGAGAVRVPTGEQTREGTRRGLT